MIWSECVTLHISLSYCPLRTCISITAVLLFKFLTMLMTTVIVSTDICDQGMLGEFGRLTEVIIYPMCVLHSDGAWSLTL